MTRPLLVDGIDTETIAPPVTAAYPDGWGWDWDRWHRGRG